MPKTDYFFPVLFLKPLFDNPVLDVPPVRFIRRQWGTSIFDLATLATRHNLHLPYQVMDVLLKSCNLEICLREQGSLDNALKEFQTLRLGLYVAGVPPFLAPFVTTHSINNYSGINSRDSDSLRKSLPDGLIEGLTSGDGLLEAWPFELSFQCTMNNSRLQVDAFELEMACTYARKWEAIEHHNNALIFVREGCNTAPRVQPLSQSLLHIWTVLEGLFPYVSSELSFKTALYLAQLAFPIDGRLEYFKKVRKAYSVRSRLTHGSSHRIGQDDWLESWFLVIDAVGAIIERGGLPTEDELLTGLLS